jgi:hypothetical protein
MHAINPTFSGAYRAAREREALIDMCGHLPVGGAEIIFRGRSSSQLC